MLITSDEHDSEPALQEKGDGIRRGMRHVHELIHDDHLRHNMLYDTIAQRQATSSV